MVANNGAAQLSAGNVMLRSDKRPRPMVLRMNAGDCIRINFQNLLAAVPTTGQNPPSVPFDPANFKAIPEPGAASDPNSQPATRLAGVHAMGLELKELQGDGSWVGANPSSLAAPGESRVYQACAAAVGTFLLYSTGADSGVSNGFGGQLSQGLFGAMIVQPRGAEWYRSQVTKEDLDLATYRANALPPGRAIAPKMSGGHAGDLHRHEREDVQGLGMTTGSGSSAVQTDVTQVDRAGDPVDQSGFIKTTTFHPIIDYKARLSGRPQIRGQADPGDAGRQEPDRQHRPDGDHHRSECRARSRRATIRRSSPIRLTRTATSRIANSPSTITTIS